MHWYYTREHTDLQTPSRKDGVDLSTEMRYRREGARFAMDMGNKLGLKYLTMATGVVFFHRFYMFHSFRSFPRWVTSTACLFLAGKVEETPKKCRDILKVARNMLSDSHWECFGDHPKEEVLMYERILLQTIKFDLQIDHPYQFLIKYGKGLKGNKEKLNELVQKAWIFINDSLSTCLCLHFQPQTIALAMLHLAAKLANQDMQTFTAQPKIEWWKIFHPDLEQEMLDEICDEMLELYGGGSGKKREHRLSEANPSTTSSPGSFGDSPSIGSSPPGKKKKSTSGPPPQDEARKAKVAKDTETVTTTSGTLPPADQPPPPPSSQDEMAQYFSEPKPPKEPATTSVANT